MAALTTTSSPMDVTAKESTSDVGMDMTSPWLDMNGSTVPVTSPEGCLVIPFSLFSPWSHPEDLVSRQTQQDVNKFLNVYILTALFLVSVPTNLLNMAVFWRHGLRERINLCLFSLAFADFVVVASHFEWNLDGLYSEIFGTPYKLVVMKFNVNNMIHSLVAFVYISGFLSTLIAFERCLCVLIPLKAQHVMHTKTTALIIVTGHVVIYAAHYVVAMRWRVVCMFDPLTNQTVDALYSSQFYLDNATLVNLFHGIIFGFLLPGVYVVGVVVFTVVTVVQLRRMTEWRQQSSTSSATTTSGPGSATKDVTLTRMLIGTSVLFVTFTAPPLLIRGILAFEPELSLSGKYYNTYYLLINVQQLCVYINSSVNFFVYYVFGSKFRHSVQSMFCKARLKAALLARKSAMDRGTALSSVSNTVSETTDINRQ